MLELRLNNGVSQAHSCTHPFFPLISGEKKINSNSLSKETETKKCRKKGLSTARRKVVEGEVSAVAFS